MKQVCSYDCHTKLSGGPPSMSLIMKGLNLEDPRSRMTHPRSMMPAGTRLPFDTYQKLLQRELSALRLLRNGLGPLNDFQNLCKIPKKLSIISIFVMLNILIF